MCSFTIFTIIIKHSTTFLNTFHHFSPLNGVVSLLHSGHSHRTCPWLLVLKIHPEKIAGGWIIIRNDSIGPFGVNAVIGDVANMYPYYIYIIMEFHWLMHWLI
jgi:hypothetical protein